MIRYGMTAVLLVGLAWGQATPAPSNPPQHAPQATAAGQPAVSSTETELSPDAPVITITGLCANPPADKSASSSCQTLISRRKFEALVDAFQPNMSPLARNQFATRYASALVMSQKARELGIDQTSKYQEKFEIAQMQLLMQILNDDLTEKANQVPDKEIEAYYQKNLPAFEEADMQRIFVPRNRRIDPSPNKPTPSYRDLPPQAAQAEMKKEADTLRARAASGEDFVKLQAEAMQFANLAGQEPNTKMDKTRRSSLPGNQTATFDLKPGQVSEVLQNTSGFLIYKMGAKDTLPLEKVRPEILETLRSQRLKDSIQAMRQSAKTQLNESYFGLPDAGSAESLVSPGPATPAPTAAQPSTY